MVRLPEWIEGVLRDNNESYTPLMVSGTPDCCILSRGPIVLGEFGSLRDAYLYALDHDDDIDILSVDVEMSSEFESIDIDELSRFWDNRHMKTSLLLKYAIWSQWVGSYHEHPGSFWMSHRFVSDHPAFWRFDGHGWNTTYVPSLEPYDPGDSSVRWCIESGASVKGTMMRYHDICMDSYGDTAEEAVIELAKNLSRLYDDDGTRRDGSE